MTLALITGVSGLSLTATERAFLADARPAGLILFARNCASGAQIRALVDDARAAVGGGALLVLIDQEGGRVQRLKPPVARLLPPAAAYATLYASDPVMARKAAFAAARHVARELKDLGINTNCAPVLDVPVEGAHHIIGDRAYGTTPAQIVDLAREVSLGHLAGGVLPVIKHIPGHGRAMADSHLDLPVVATPRAQLMATDFATFKALAHLPVAMTAHVVFSDIDEAAPASTSLLVTRDIIRGHIGFGGLLMSDDLSMKALTGSMRSRAESVIASGSDLALHCNGDMAEMTEAAAGVPKLSGLARARFESAIALTEISKPFDAAEAEQLIKLAETAHATAAESV
jgi:beta-N-acetylhexosaminidase